MRPPELRTVLRVVSMVLLGFIGLIMVGLGTSVVVARSNWGQRKLLGVVVPLINQGLTGRVEIGGIGGDLLHRLVLRDLRLYDSETVLAASVREASVSYRLSALLHREVHITSAELKDAKLSARFLRDERLNLAALLKPGPPGGPLPVTITIDKLVLDLYGTLVPLPGTQVPPVKTLLHLEAAAKIADPRITADLTRLKLYTSDPLDANVELSGGASLVTGPQLQVEARDLMLRVHTTVPQVHRLAQAAVGQGNVELLMKLQGPLTALSAQALLRLPKGSIGLKGTLGVLAPELPWQVFVDAQRIDPAALFAGIPEANIDLRLQGHGQGPMGRLELQELLVSFGGASLKASGFAEGSARLPLGFPLPKGIAAQLVLDLDAPELAAVLRPFAPPSLKPAGALLIDAKAVADKGQLRLDLELLGKRLRAAGSSVERLTFSLHSQDLLGLVKLHADAVHGPLVLSRLDLDAGMNRQALSVHAIGRLMNDLVLELQVSGQPHLAGQRLLSLNASLNQLFLTRDGQRLSLLTPAHIALDMQPAEGPVVDLGRLAVRLDQQRLTLSGHFEARAQRFRASLDALSINARQWAQLGGIRGIPRSALDLHVQAAGTPRAPQGSIRLKGSIDAMPDWNLPGGELQAQVNVHDLRAQGELSATLLPSRQPGQPAPGGPPPRASLRFDAPLLLSGPLSALLHVETPTQSFASLLPAPARSLRGLLALDTRLGGTLQQPELYLTLKVPSWSLQKLRGIGTVFELSYAHELLSLRLDSEVATAPVAHIATAMLRAETQVKLGLWPASVLSAAELKRRLLQGAMAVDASVLHAELPQFLAVFAGPNAAQKLLAGQLSATLHVTGTPETPAVKLRIDAQDLATDTPSLRNLAVHMNATYTGSELRTDVVAGLPNKPLLKGHGTTFMAMKQALNGELHLQRLPLSAVVEVLPFELSQISPLRGQLIARAAIQGTAGAPEVSGWIRSQGVQLEKFALGPLSVSASLDHERLLSARVDIKEQGKEKKEDGLLALVASSAVPPRLDALQVNLLARNFLIDYNPTPGKIRPKAPLGMAHAVLNADLKVQGSKAGPTVRGFFKLEQGALVMKALEQALGDIYIDLLITPPPPGSRRTVVALRQARLMADTGKAAVSGSVELEGQKLSKVTLQADARQFPIWAAVMGIWIDAKVQANGYVDGDTLRVNVDIPDGGVRLPKFQSARSVQPLGAFEGVHLIDPMALKDAARIREQEESKPEPRAPESANSSPPSTAFLPAHMRVAMRLPNDFHVSGPELHTELTGQLAMSLDHQGLPRITGQVRNAQSFGWVEILKRRYEIEHIEVSLDGKNPPNPLINIELSRALSDTTVYIMVHGSANKPEISFRSDPPVLDESQIIATILTGEHGSAGDTQAMGLLSSLLIGQLRDQLADRLPVDVLRVQVAGDDPMGVNQSSLEIGKYLRDNVYLGYTRRFGSATTGLRRVNADEIDLEYHFFQNYKLKALYGDANVGAIDLYWSKRF